MLLPAPPAVVAPVQVDCCPRLLLTEFLPGPQGDKVKFTLQFRGREMQYKDDGQQMLQVSVQSACRLGTLRQTHFQARVAQDVTAELRV